MRRPLFYALAAVVACQGALFRIDVAGDASTVVPRGTLVESLIADFGFEDLVSLDITESEELANQGVEPGDIAEARFTVLTLSATAPSGADLSFLDSVTFFVEADGLPRTRVASSTAFEPGAASVDLTLEDVDLTDFVVSRAMTITADVSGRRPDDDTTVEVAYVLDVAVTGQGACNYIRGE